MSDRKEQFSEFLSDYFAVVMAHDLGPVVLEAEVVPEDNSTPDPEEFAASEVPKTAISKKQDVYASDIYSLYHDLKLAIVSEMVKIPINSPQYQRLDGFFKFLVDLLLREAHRLGFMQQSTVEEDMAKTEEGDFENELFRGLVRVYTDYAEWTEEAYSVMTESTPLFSVGNGKSPIDYRDTEVPGHFNTTVILNHQTGSAPTQMMANVSPIMLKYPHPSMPPTEMMKSFVHPVGANLSATKWLKFDGYTSYAPLRDDGGVVMDSEASSAVWFEKIAQKRMVTEEEIKEAAEKRIKELEGMLSNDKMDIDRPESNGNDDNSKGTETTNNEQQSATSNNTATSTAATTTNNNGVSNTTIKTEDESTEEPDLVGLFNWRPNSFVDDDEIEAAKAGTEHQLASQLIIKLQTLQRQRLARNDKTEFEISPEERKTAMKLQNVLARLVGDRGALKMSLSGDIPVLQSNYRGTLPAPEMKSSRLASIRGSNRPSRRK
ncbi:chromatin structure-remodeling complex protein Rsc58p [Trichomonascus vanleenenianus]|uniref:Rsc58p n=1 Tax=Trichomonascus vanleenenianus TaxID=2268995 RepID=UPI003ECAC895